MGKPLKSVFKKEHRDDVSNPSTNPAFSSVAEIFLSRRRLLQLGAVAGAAAAFPLLIKPEQAFGSLYALAAGEGGLTRLYQHRRIYRG